MSIDRDAIIQTLVEDTTDKITWSILADWYADSGDEYGEQLIRDMLAGPWFSAAIHSFDMKSWHESNLARSRIGEINRCGRDFQYFCNNYVKIQVYQPNDIESWSQGGKYVLTPCKLLPDQINLARLCDNNNCVIGKKYRQGGFTTFGVIRFLWVCLFNMEQKCLYLARSDREAIYTSDIVKKAMEYLPDWMRRMAIDNDHTKKFSHTGSSIAFSGLRQPLWVANADHVFVDEAAFAGNMDEAWERIKACPHKLILSTPNGTDNWFHKTYTTDNEFARFICDYRSHPSHTPDLAKRMREMLGERGFRMEVEQEFV